MARMPIDPRISRMLLEAADENCLEEVAVIASALSIQDPGNGPQTGWKRHAAPTVRSITRRRIS